MIKIHRIASDTGAEGPDRAATNLSFVPLLFLNSKTQHDRNLKDINNKKRDVNGVP